MSDCLSLFDLRSKSRFCRPHHPDSKTTIGLTPKPSSETIVIQEGGENATGEPQSLTMNSSTGDNSTLSTNARVPEPSSVGALLLIGSLFGLLRRHIKH